MSSRENPPTPVEPPTTRVWIFIAVTLAAILMAALLPRIPQDPAYHDFADRRALFGISNFWDVVTNVGYLLVGVLGLAFLLRRRESAAWPVFIRGSERWLYVVFFFGVAATAFGSAYYHLAPSNGRLVWDRLPMSLGFMGLMAAVIAERISATLGLRLLVPLSLLGVASVEYWHITEAASAGDLRPYLLVQFYPLVAIVLLLALFPPRYTRGADLLVAFALYVAAKLFEVLDKSVFALGHILSGHTLKHLVSAFAIYWIYRMLRLRSPAPAK